MAKHNGHDADPGTGATETTEKAWGEFSVEGVTFETQMMVLTWLTFAVVAILLLKFCWKPLMANLDQREDDIRTAADNSEKTRQALEQIEETRSQVISEADEKAKDIVSAARKAAGEVGNVIEQKAREEAQILLENANREIGAARDKAIAGLRLESADLAISLAGKILEENLDTAKNRELVDKMIGHLE